MNPRLRQALVGLRARLRWVRGLFPLTALGVLATAFATAWLVTLAFEAADLVALTVGWVLLGVVAAGLTSTLLAALYLRVTGRTVEGPTALRLVTGEPQPTGYRPRSVQALPLATDEHGVVAPDGLRSELRDDDEGRLEWLFAERRGRHSHVVRRVRVGDAFGLCRIDYHLTRPLELLVLPHVGGLGRMPTLRSMRGGDERAHPLGDFEGDRVDVRRYAPSDEARHIHWPVLARTGKLVVRVRERALAETDRVAAYLVAGPHDEASAGAARAALEGGALGAAWSFGADGSPRPTQAIEAAHAAIAASAAAHGEGGVGLDGFLRAVEAEGPAGLVLFLPVVAGPWLDAVERVLRGRHGTHCVLAVDTLDEDAPAPALARWMRLPSDTARPSAAALDAVLERLRAAGASCTVVERPTGRVRQRVAAHAAAQRGAA